MFYTPTSGTQHDTFTISNVQNALDTESHLYCFPRLI